MLAMIEAIHETAIVQHMNRYMLAIVDHEMVWREV